MTRISRRMQHKQLSRDRKSWREFYALDPTPLGKGGQAEVVRARDRQTGTYYALKRVLEGSPEGLARMRREVEAQRAIEHPNMMPVLRHSTSYSWYVMPLARTSLGKMSTPIPDDIIIEILEAALAVLRAAHSHGLVHRDITPSNILDTGESGRKWVLADWGLVHIPSATTLTQSGEFGTAGYAAPETWKDAHNVDHRADIYSLGRVIAWCVTGSTPAPNVPLNRRGRWDELIKSTTTLSLKDRCQTLDELRLLLSRALEDDIGTELFGPKDEAVAVSVELMNAVVEEMNRSSIPLPWPIGMPFSSYFALRAITGYVMAGNEAGARKAIQRYSGVDPNELVTLLKAGLQSLRERDRQ